MIFEVLSTSSSSFKFYKPANLFVISFWHCSLNSSSFSFLKLNICLSNLRAACNFTNSPGSGEGEFSEPVLMSQIRRLLRFLCAYISVFAHSELWRWQY
jgi:hypothetical protein